MRLSRRSVLASLGAGGLVGWRAHAAQPRNKLVVVISAGGWDPTFSVDPKPDRTSGGPYPDLDPFDPLDEERIVSFGPIAVTTNASRRPQIAAYFDRWADHTTVVNGLWTGSLGHWQAMDQILTGTADPNAPDFGVIVGSQLGTDLPLAHLDLSGVSRFGPLAPQCARAGIRGQLAALLDPSVRFDTPDGPRPSWSLTEEDREAIASFRAAQASDPVRDEVLARATLLQDRADAIVAALPTGRRSLFADQIPFAVELLASETCATVAVGTGFAWDSHGSAVRQHAAWNGTFGGLADLCEQLSAAGLLPTTTVVAVSELGRTPLRNATGGTDHWPYTSALVIRGTPTGPRLIGGTDADSVGLRVDPLTGTVSADGELLTFARFAASVVAHTGADPEPWLPGIAPLPL